MEIISLQPETEVHEIGGIKWTTLVKDVPVVAQSPQDALGMVHETYRCAHALVRECVKLRDQIRSLAAELEELRMAISLRPPKPDPQPEPPTPDVFWECDECRARFFNPDDFHAHTCQ